MAKDFCDLFDWPKMKTFTFRLCGEESANQLARDWVRKSNHYMIAWLESGGLQTFRDPETINYEGSLEFLDWASAVDDLEGATFARVRELHDQKPVFQL